MSESKQGFTVEHKANMSKSAKVRYARQIANGEKSLWRKGSDAYFAKLAEDESPEHAIRTSYAMLKKKPLFSLQEALEMSLLEYAVRTIDCRERQSFVDTLNGFVFDILYPDAECVLCESIGKIHRHHVTRNDTQHGKGRVLWIVPLCSRCHKNLHEMPIGDLDLRLYEIAKQHPLPDGIEIDIEATRNLTFEEALEFEKEIIFEMSF